MSLDLRELYQEVILDHNRHPRNSGEIETPTATAEGHNPLCGDEIKVYLREEGGRIVDLKFSGHGCAISTASASLMTEAVLGKSTQEALALVHQFQRVVTGKEEPTEEMGELAALAGVRDYPVRVKCATLAWHTFEEAIVQSGSEVSTE